MIPQQSTSKRALETCEFTNMPVSPMGSKHLSKSASELSSPREMPEIRPRSAAPPGTSHLSVYQKTHSFFTQLKSRWARSKSRERRHKSPGRQDSTGTDYTADLSSDHSSPSTQSPRHRLHTYTVTRVLRPIRNSLSRRNTTDNSPLSRVCAGDTSHSSASGSPKPRAPTPGAVAGLDLLPLTTTDDATRRRETALRQHSFFQLRIHLRRGQGLVAMDKNGTSDPYVKFKNGGRLIYKSRTVYRDLNPVWDESFTVAIEDPFVHIQMKVFDYDWGLQDDFMGSASLDLTTLDLGKTTDITLCLQDPSRSSAQLGEIMLTATLYPKSQEDKEQLQGPKMFEATPQKKTRKVQACLTRLGDKLQRELSLSVHDIVVTEKHLARSFRKLVHYSSTSDIDKLANDSDKANTMREREYRRPTVFYDAEDKGASSDNEVVIKKKLPDLVIENVDGIQHKHPEDGEHQFDSNILKKLKETSDKVHRYFQKNARISDINKRLKSQIWSSVVTIVLVEGRNLLACDPETGTSDPYVKFRLGNEKYKSKVIWRSLNPRWLEQFDLHLYDDGDQQLEVTVWDKDRSRDDFIGRCVIDLSDLERERTHGFWQELEEGAGSLNLLLTISGTTASETISDLTTHEETPRERNGLLARYAWQRTFHNIKDVGHLTVKVFRAAGLAAADIGGKSDPFCVVELGNARLQTQTEYKTLTPSWQKIFTFNIRDINNVLEITVYDEDRDHKVEFLGKVAIPLLRVRSGEKRWYALKDKKLRSRAKGNSPQILLEMTVIWNPIRGCIRTLNPKEVKYMQPEVKFKRQVFVKNVLRLKVIIMHFYEFGKLIQSCFEWESTFQSFVGLLFWLILCYYFQPWMVPAAGLLFFLKQYIVKALSGPVLVPWDEIADSDIDEDEDDDKDKEEKKSLKERLQAIQEVTQSVQNTIGKLATLGESVKNTFNFTVPYLSWIAVTLLVGAGFVLYFIPVRYLLMLWGANKFVRRLVRPHSVPNNEVLDLLSRVPDDEMLLDYRDLKPSLINEPERRREQRKKQKAS